MATTECQRPASALQQPPAASTGSSLDRAIPWVQGQVSDSTATTNYGKLGTLNALDAKRDSGDSNSSLNSSHQGHGPAQLAISPSTMASLRSSSMFDPPLPTVPFNWSPTTSYFIARTGGGLPSARRTSMSRQNQFGFDSPTTPSLYAIKNGLHQQHSSSQPHGMPGSTNHTLSVDCTTSTVSNLSWSETWDNGITPGEMTAMPSTDLWTAHQRLMATDGPMNGANDGGGLKTPFTASAFIRNAAQSGPGAAAGGFMKPCPTPTTIQDYRNFGQPYMARPSPRSAGLAWGTTWQEVPPLNLSDAHQPHQGGQHPSGLPFRGGLVGSSQTSMNGHALYTDQKPPPPPPLLYQGISPENTYSPSMTQLTLGRPPLTARAPRARRATPNDGNPMQINHGGLLGFLESDGRRNPISISNASSSARSSPRMGAAVLGGGGGGPTPSMRSFSSREGSSQVGTSLDGFSPKVEQDEHDELDEGAAIIKYSNDEARWKAVQTRDARASAAFFYCVLTTKIFCRTTCPSRRPVRDNIIFVNSSTEATINGFRACKRCKPDISGGDPHEERQEVLINRVKEKLLQTIAEGGQGKAVKGKGLKYIAEELGVSHWHLHRCFKKRVGNTPEAWAKEQAVRMSGGSSRSESRDSMEWQQAGGVGGSSERSFGRR